MMDCYKPVVKSVYSCFIFICQPLFINQTRKKQLINQFALRNAKTVYSFGLSGCKRVNEPPIRSPRDYMYFFAMLSGRH